MIARAAPATLALRLLLDEELLPDALSTVDWDGLLRATTPGALLRATSRLLALGARSPAHVLAAVERERRRSQAGLELIAHTARVCTAHGIACLFPKVYQHYPDMGDDIDVLLLTESWDADGLILAGLPATPFPRDLGTRLAAAAAYAVSDVAPALDLQHGRLGASGEDTTFPAVLWAGRQHVTAGGIAFDTANVQELTFTLSGALGESETGGASITIVPRTGGNRFAGSYFTSYLDDSFFDRNRGTRLSNTPATQDVVKDFDVNGGFGGPIKRDRLWFYVNARTRGDEKYPNGGTVGGFANKNEGVFGANYQPLRGDGSKDYWLTYTSEQKNVATRITWQATQKNKFNMAWDEQDACTNPCKGMINIVDSPESYFSLENRPNRLRSVSWTNPFTNRVLFEGQFQVVWQHYDYTKHKTETNPQHIPQLSEGSVGGCCVGRDDVSDQVHTGVGGGHPGSGSCFLSSTMCSGSIYNGDLNRQGSARPRLSMSYITGSHSFKVGFNNAWGYHDNTTYSPESIIPGYGPAQGVQYQFTNGSPSAIVLRSHPRTAKVEVDNDLGLFVQDKWTTGRWSLAGGIRYDLYQNSFPEQYREGERHLDARESGAIWGRGDRAAANSRRRQRRHPKKMPARARPGQPSWFSSWRRDSEQAGRPRQCITGLGAFAPAQHRRPKRRARGYIAPASRCAGSAPVDAIADSRKTHEDDTCRHRAGDRRRRAQPLDDGQHAERAVVHGRDHGNRRCSRKRHPARHVRGTVPERRRRRRRGRDPGCDQSSAADSHDDLRHDRRDGSDGSGG